MDEIVSYQTDQRQIMLNNLEKKVEGLEGMLVEKQQEVDQVYRVNSKLQKLYDDQKQEIDELKSIISRQASRKVKSPRSRQLSFPSGGLFSTSPKNPIPPGARLNLIGNPRKRNLMFGALNTHVENERGNLVYQSPSRNRGALNTDVENERGNLVYQSPYRNRGALNTDVENERGNLLYQSPSRNREAMNTEVENGRGNLLYQSPSRNRGRRNDFAMDFKTPDWKR